MKKNAWAELKGKAAADLARELSAREERLASLRMDLAAGKVKNVREIRETRKTIARIKGLLNNLRLTTNDQRPMPQQVVGRRS